MRSIGEKRKEKKRKRDTLHRLNKYNNYEPAFHSQNGTFYGVMLHKVIRNLQILELGIF